MDKLKEAAEYIRKYMADHPNTKDLAQMYEEYPANNRKYISQAIIGIEPWKHMSYIPALAFTSCKNITSIVLPSDIMSIGDYAFQFCEGLTSIEIPDSVTSIGWNAFEGCTKLSSISIGKGVAMVRSNAFPYCFRVSTISIHNPKTYFEKSSIDTANLTDIYYMGTRDECRRYLNLKAFYADDGGEVTINCSDGKLWIKYFPELEEYRFTF